MKQLVFPAPLFEAVFASLAMNDGVEAAAIAFVVPANSEDDVPATKYLAREFWVPDERDYLSRTADRVQLNGDFILRALVHAQREKAGVVFIHSHPFQEQPNFSLVDDAAEQRLALLFSERAPARAHFALVAGRTGTVSGRELGGAAITVKTVGVRVKTISSHSEPTLTGDEVTRYDRQIKALSREGQATISEFKVGIVGLGGTGSHVAQQLAYLGFRDFVLVDPDKVELTNTNRVAGSHPTDIERLKVDVARDMIQAVRPGAHVECIADDVVRISVLRVLRHVDAIMICTDSHGSRAVLNRLAYQFLVPSIDLGSHIHVSEEGTVQMLGRVQLLAPGLACLHCYLNVLDANLVRLELMHPQARARDPYGFPAHVTQPAVISINGVVSSLAVTMLLQTLTPISGEARSLRYDAVTGRLREATARALSKCPDCSRNYGTQGDNAGILARAEVDE